MRLLHEHIVEGDSTNHQLRIAVTDEPGVGGANHAYEITGFDACMHPGLQVMDHVDRAVVLFQNGPIKEVGVNGVTHEALLAILIDRLEAFQRGPYSSSENANALDHCQQALDWLQERTRLRLARGVEGTHQK